MLLVVAGLLWSGGPLRDVGATGRMSANVELAVPPPGTRASVRGRFVLRSHQKCVPQHQAPEIAHSSGLGLDAEARQVECICVCNFLLQRFRSPVLKYLVLNGFPWVKFFWRVFFELWSSVVPPLILCPYGQCISWKFMFFLKSNAFRRDYLRLFFTVTKFIPGNCFLQLRIPFHDDSWFDHQPWKKRSWGHHGGAWLVWRVSWQVLAPSWAVYIINEALVLLWTLHGIRTMSRRFGTQWNHGLTHGLHEM